jgi:hypothetical protein
MMYVGLQVEGISLVCGFIVQPEGPLGIVHCALLAFKERRLGLRLRLVTRDRRSQLRYSEPEEAGISLAVLVTVH